VSQPFASTPPRPSQQYVFQQTALASPVVLSQSAPGASYRQLFQFPLQSSRVCAFTSSCSMVCVGEALGAASFGIVKLSTADSRHAVRISAHSSTVRDLSINAQNDIVLSVAWDGKAAVSSLRSDSVVMQYTLPPTRRNAWSCCFSQANPFEFFCGFQDGTIARYDMRRQATTADESIVALYRLPVGQPVHSIQVSPVMGGGLEQLIAGTFSGFGIWGSDELRQPSVGETPTAVSSFRAAPNCCSVSGSQTKRGHLLVTTRSQPPTVSAKHALYELPTALSGSSEPVLRSSMEGFRTPQAMSRAAVWEARSGDTMVASWDDELKQVNIWNETSKQVQSRVTREGSQPVVDVQHVIADGEWRRAKALLGVLSPQRLVVYAGSE
jgi:WD40 repeat protein